MGSTPLDSTITSCIYAIREAYAAGLVEDAVDSQNMDILSKIGITYNEGTRILSRTNGEDIQIWPPSKSELISTKFNNLFYDRLVSEINFCYRCACFQSVTVLARKMAENIVIEILRTQYKNHKTKGLNLYWDKRKGRFHDLSFLLDILEKRNKTNIFGPEKDTIKKVVSLMKPFRKNSNATAHSLIENPTEQQVHQMKIPEIIALLHQVKINI